MAIWSIVPDLLRFVLYYSSPHLLLLGSNLNAGFVARHLSSMF